MSPTYFEVRKAELDEQIEAARLAGGQERLQQLLGDLTILLRSMFG